jgi:hypothetical protein
VEIDEGGEMWDWAKIVENGDVRLSSGWMMGLASLLMLIEVNSSRRTTLYRPEQPDGPPEPHAWPSTLNRTQPPSVPEADYQGMFDAQWLLDDYP